MTKFRDFIIDLFLQNKIREELFYSLVKNEEQKCEKILLMLIEESKDEAEEIYYDWIYSHLPNNKSEKKYVFMNPMLN